MTEHRGPYNIPPPLLRLHTPTLGKSFVLFFVPVARVLSPVVNGLQAVPAGGSVSGLPSFVQAERITVTDPEDGRSLNGVIQFIPSAVVGQQSIRYDAVVAAFEYRKLRSDMPLFHYVQPIAAFYHAVVGLVAARTAGNQLAIGGDDMIEETRVLHMRAAKNEAALASATQFLLAIERACQTVLDESKPMNKSQQLFYSKYENCTAPPLDARALYKVMGARNWNDWGAQFSTLFVATTKMIVPKEEDKAELMQISRTEMLNRVYFMKKAWPGLSKDTTIPLLFLKYMGVVDYSRAGGMAHIIQLLVEHEALISELAYFFGPKLPTATIAKDAIRLFFEPVSGGSTKKAIESYLNDLASRIRYCQSVYVHPATYMMMVRLPHSNSRVGVPIFIGSQIE
jgi:hypothetical protein